MPRVYVPNPMNKKLEEVVMQLYILKTALKTESSEKLEQRIDKLRQEVSDLIAEV